MSVSDKAFQIVHPSWMAFFGKHGFVDRIKRALDLILVERGTANIVPRLENVLRFATFPMSEIKVVLIGQDPYPDAANASGLAFSTGCATIPPSLKNIYRALVKQHIIGSMPATGDLIRWAEQGVLLLNTALTTLEGASGKHVAHWEPITRDIVAALSIERSDIVYILLGTSSKKLKPHIKKSYGILLWGHPSPLNRDNQDETSEKHFNNCPAFQQTNNILISHGANPINWDPTGATASASTSMQRVDCASTSVQSAARIVADEIMLDADDALTGPDEDTIFAFVDGAATGNGRQDCVAAFAVIIVRGSSCIKWSAKLDPAKPQSNNRAELTAFLELFKELQKPEYAEVYDPQARLLIIYDSMYAAQSVREWYDKWCKRPNADLKKNLDLISVANTAYKAVHSKRKIDWYHTGGHKKEPEQDPCDPMSERGLAWYAWYGNKCVDELAQKTTK